LREFVQASIPGWMSYRESTTPITRTGDPASVIVAVAAEFGARMIVMGTHGRHGLSRMLFGSVTASVLAHAAVPVAVVPPSEPEIISLAGEKAIPHFGAVLVPVDLTADTDRQLAFASALAAGASRDVTLLHAIPEGADSGWPLGRLNELATRMPRGARAVVTHGVVTNVIRHRQQACGAGVIVLGRSAGAPGRIACELLETTHAVVVFVP
jgi:nucleotide-binding universal stress UspA family protein